MIEKRWWGGGRGVLGVVLTIGSKVPIAYCLPEFSIFFFFSVEFPFPGCHWLEGGVGDGWSGFGFWLCLHTGAVPHPAWRARTLTTYPVVATFLLGSKTHTGT